LGNQSPSAGDGYGGHTNAEGFSTMGSNQKAKLKTITDVLNERI